MAKRETALRHRRGGGGGTDRSGKRIVLSTRPPKTAKQAKRNVERVLQHRHRVIVGPIRDGWRVTVYHRERQGTLGTHTDAHRLAEQLVDAGFLVGAR